MLIPAAIAKLIPKKKNPRKLNCEHGDVKVPIDANRVQTDQELQQRCKAFTDSEHQTISAARQIKLLSNLRAVDEAVWKRASSAERAVVIAAYRTAEFAIGWLLDEREAATGLSVANTPAYTRLEAVIAAAMRHKFTPKQNRVLNRL